MNIFETIFGKNKKEPEVEEEYEECEEREDIRS